MKKILYTILLAIFILYGCTGSKLAKKEEKDTYKKIDNSSITYGNNRAKDKFEFIEEINGQITKKLTFYIDKYPYKINIDLCKETGKYKFLKSVETNSKKESKANYIDKKVDCTSYLTIGNSFIKNDKYAKFSFTFLNGFRIQYLKKYPILLSEKQTFKEEGIIFYDKINNETSSFSMNQEIKTYTYFGSNK